MDVVACGELGVRPSDANGFAFGLPLAAVGADDFAFAALALPRAFVFALAFAVARPREAFAGAFLREAAFPTRWRLTLALGFDRNLDLRLAAVAFLDADFALDLALDFTPVRAFDLRFARDAMMASRYWIPATKSKLWNRQSVVSRV
jgi:hypothetical protein